MKKNYSGCQKTGCSCVLCHGDVALVSKGQAELFRDRSVRPAFPGSNTSNGFGALLEARFGMSGSILLSLTEAGLLQRIFPI